MERKEIVKSEWVKEQFRTFFNFGVILHNRIVKDRGEKSDDVFQEVYDFIYNGKNKSWED